MNVQINEHHPLASNTSLLYTIKYPLKPEPMTTLTARHDSDDSVVHFLRGQFVSLSSATAFLLQEPVTKSSRGETPRIYPCWHFEEVPVQGLWMRYLRRWPYEALDRPRPGTFVPTVAPQALQLSVLFAACLRFLRYFVDDARLPLAPPPKQVTRKHLRGDLYDDPTHPHFDPVLSELLPVEHLVIADHQDTRDVWKRVANSRLHFPRFGFEHDLSLKENERGRSHRSCHFERRLFHILPWTWLRIGAPENSTSNPADPPDIGMILELPDEILVSPVPFQACVWPASLLALLDIYNLPIISAVGTAPQVQAWSLRRQTFSILGQAPWEEVCICLEKFFSDQKLPCTCCEEPREQRCTWCVQACGWHRCQKRCLHEQISLSCVAAWRWKRHSLYNLQGHDIDAAVFDMLRRGDPQKKITRMLTNLHTNNLLTKEHLSELLRLVLANINAVVDSDPILSPSSQRLVLSHAELQALQETPEGIRTRLNVLEKRMQQHWDHETCSYRPWNEFQPARRVPSQYLAWRALLKRLDTPASFFIALVAPAGFGKTEFLAALRLHCLLHRLQLTCLAVTGVAAAQNAGSTVHSFLYLTHENEARILQSPVARRRFAGIQILVVDEAMMAESDLMLLLREICREIPLTSEMRRPGAFPDFGYRDVIVCGDIRQLPPASGKQPFWASHTFQESFEIFSLQEDRRHEKDLHMQTLKELFAWGGCVPPLHAWAQQSQPSGPSDTVPAEPDLSRAWPVDARVFDFAIAGYLRGWGRTGNNVDLDFGTALFPKRVDVRNWNDACIDQIEDTYKDSCEAVDVVGCDPFAKEKLPDPDKRLTHGIQTLPVLRLRTHPQHRMRFMLLHNLNVKEGWVNGTRTRLLPHFSWTGEAKTLQRNAEESSGKVRWIVQDGAYITLENESKYPEFNVKVVKDEDFVLKKSVRFDDSHVKMIPVRTDESLVKGVAHAWKQVQGVPAYALTVHKAQGLTMHMVFLAMSKVFGFGLAYTALTRCPYVWSTLLVGVPPRDVLATLLRRDTDGLTLIDRKRHEIQALLEDDATFTEHVQERIDSGEFDLERLAQDMRHAATDVPACDLTTEPERNLQARKEVEAQIRVQHQEWIDRLDVDTGLAAMLQVSTGFKRNALTGVTTYANQNDNWQTLAEAFQIDAATRQRILFYRSVAVDWMTHPDVNALSKATVDDARLPTRVAAERSRVVSYGETPRPPCPQPPAGFVWGVGIDERNAHKRKAASASKDTEQDAAVPVSGQPSAEVSPPGAPQDSVPPASIFDLRLPASRQSASVTDRVAIPKTGNKVQIVTEPKAAQPPTKRRKLQGKQTAAKAGVPKEVPEQAAAEAANTSATPLATSGFASEDVPVPTGGASSSACSNSAVGPSAPLAASSSDAAASEPSQTSESCAALSSLPVGLERPPGTLPVSAASSTSSAVGVCTLCRRKGMHVASGSEECAQFQRRTGCHACGLLGCWVGSASCGFVGRPRGFGVQEPASQDVLALGRGAPDIFLRNQIRLSTGLNIYTPRRTAAVFIDGDEYCLTLDDATDNNCLIHAIWHALCSWRVCCAVPRTIRESLLQQFRARDDAHVSQTNFLTFHLHALPIVAAIQRQNNNDPQFAVENFTIKCIACDRGAVGASVGSGPVQVFVLNFSQLHYVGLMRRRA
jgi:hypothetical protein